MSPTTSDKLQTPSSAADDLSVKSKTWGKRTGGKVALSELYVPVADDLAAVESILEQELKSDTPFVDALLDHSSMLGGKRVRPLLLLLSARAVAGTDESRESRDGTSLDDSVRFMAAAVEMIHTATLVHDDVLDQAEVRRHRPTAHVRWGNRISVLLGDYLFTHAFHVASKSGSVGSMAKLASSSNLVCAGEMKQNYHVKNFEMEPGTYFEIISQKTAELCASSCGIGALLAGADEQVTQQFEDYGRHLGMAFQIVDDVLDLTGSEDTVGKTLGTDLVNGKPTLPMIHALSVMEQAKRQRLLELLKSGDDIDAAIGMMQEAGSFDYASKIAVEHIAQAESFARSLAETPASNSLVSIASFVVKRSR